MWGIGNILSGLVFVVLFISALMLGEWIAPQQMIDGQIHADSTRITPASASVRCMSEDDSLFEYENGIARVSCREDGSY